jgi:hypothetical protein
VSYRRGKILEERGKGTMKPDKNEKATRFVLSLICFTAYISLFFAVIANAFNAHPYGFLMS